MNNNVCVFGGQFGSEGKGCVTEHLMRHLPFEVNLAVSVADPGPNSGHTCSLGKVRNIPASSFFTNETLLGPNSAIDFDVLRKDLDTITKHNRHHRLFIHEHAGVVLNRHIDQDDKSGLVDKVGITATGGGRSRSEKYHNRKGAVNEHWTDLRSKLGTNKVSVEMISRLDWIELMHTYQEKKSVYLLVECAQGALLDPDHGYWPYCTSRNTLPDVVLSRLGFNPCTFRKCGVYRTFPIRTGGNTGPTGGPEMEWSQLMQEPEIASVTGRVRHVFRWSPEDFLASILLTRPDHVFITHMDYYHRFYHEQQIQDVARQFYLDYIKKTVDHLSYKKVDASWSHVPSIFNPVIL